MKIAQNLGTFEPPTTAYSGNSTDINSAASNLEKLISNIIGSLTILGGLALIVYFLVAALNWLMAGGDSGKVQKARDQMVQGVLGMIILIAGYSIIGLISKVLGLNILTPGQSIIDLWP